MSIIDSARRLRQELALLAANPDWGLLQRHDLLAKKKPLLLRERLWHRFRVVLAAIGLLPPHLTYYPWLPTLKHVPVEGDYRPLLIWALGLPRHELREACTGFSRRLQHAKGLVPVLVTDVADFAYFSRLGWLVEYVPSLSGAGFSYSERKRRFLAWRYQDALILPGAAGLVGDAEWSALLNEN